MLLTSLFISELKTHKAIDRQELLFVPCTGWQLGNWVRLGLLSTDTHPLCISSTEQAICAKQVLGFQWNEASIKAYPVKLFCRRVKAFLCKGDQVETLCYVSISRSPFTNLHVRNRPFFFGEPAVTCPVVTVDFFIGWVSNNSHLPPHCLSAPFSTLALLWMDLPELSDMTSTSLDARILGLFSYIYKNIILKDLCGWYLLPLLL